MSKQDFWPLTAIGAVLAVTAGWWALALWPLPADAPAWLERARSVCFNTGDSGLPQRSGWLLLTGQPLGMLGLLAVGWGGPIADSLRRVMASPAGRAMATLVLGAVALGLGAAGVRVATAATPEDVTLWGPTNVPETYPRLDRSAPAMSALVDQAGRPFDWAGLAGRRAFVTFAFGHCGTMCPAIVHATRTAREALAPERELAIVVVTLDPWRDTPARLPSLEEVFELEPARGDRLLSGSVEDVEAVLDAWNVARQRDLSTGDIIHPALVYLVEADGTVAYASGGVPEQLEELGRRLR